MAGWFGRAFPNPAFAGPARPAVLAGYGREHGRRGVGRLYGLKIAPTCVGKTYHSFSLPDFPLETPPHAWGRRSYGQGLRLARRNTPTCVGKTRTGHFRNTSSRKHPHMRGEDLGLDTSNLSKMETPPHAWGRPRGPCGDRSREGNTPTCVGKTLCYRGDLRHSWKHPHMRGEDAPLISG